MICEQKINSYNMLIKELMKELGYYTEEEYNINTELNKRHYDNIMNSDIKTDMKTDTTIVTGNIRKSKKNQRLRVTGAFWKSNNLNDCFIFFLFKLQNYKIF